MALAKIGISNRFAGESANRSVKRDFWLGQVELYSDRCCFLCLERGRIHSQMLIDVDLNFNVV